MNKILFSFYFLIIILDLIIYIIPTFIVLPFKTYQNIPENKNQGLNMEEFFQNYFSNIIYTQIEVGTPKNLIPIEITSNLHGLSIGYLCGNNFDSKKSLYNNKSTSFYRETQGIITYPQYEGGFFAKDSFTFYTDLENNSKNQITVSNISFIYLPEESKGSIKDNTNKNNEMCGKMGISLNYNNYCEEQRNIINNLNKLDIIKKYTYCIYYKDKDEGYIIIGEEPHIIFSKEFNENDLRKVNSLSEGYNSFEWKTEFTQIYFYDNDVKVKLMEAKLAKFAIEINYIVGTNEYRKNIENHFFKNYLQNNICKYEKIENKRYSFLVCNKNSDFKIDNFPRLYFYHRIFNYIFEITKDELFLEKNDKYIFLVFFSDYDIKYFVLGKIFLRKYLLTFNQDSKIIGFYNSDSKNEVNYEKNNLLLKVVGIIVIIICSIFGFYLAKKIYDQTRKRRINEINEQYEYNSYENNNIKDENDKNKIFLEMPTKNN